MALELLAVAKVLKAPVDDLYGSAKGNIKQKLKIWTVEKNINELYKKIYSFRKVKTIWQVEKPIDLNSFYYPSNIEIENERFKVTKLDELPDYTGVVIQGTVGQGKSIFLRYLCSQELRKGSRIPIFVELRKIGKFKGLTDLIMSALADLGFICDQQMFDYLCSSGKLIFLLDGFDEVPNDLVMSSISTIESIMARNPKAKFVITSRLGCAIQRSSNFSVYNLAPLKPQDHEGILNKLISDSDQRSSLLIALEASNSDIVNLLKTPLMMTLMVLLYRSFQEIPTDFSDFYSKLFSTLLIKHDGAKPGFIRERRCVHGERELQKAFERFCFECSKLNVVSMSSDRAADIAEIISKDFDFLASDFIHDISKVACLLVEDGFDYQFIHKSVREFYSASFISKQNENFCIKFYSKMLETKGEWKQELNFLSILDEYRYNKYFLLDFLKRDLFFWGVSDLENYKKMS